MKNKIEKVIQQCLEIIPCNIDVRYDEPMSKHTTFKVGGPADCLVSVSKEQRAIVPLERSKENAQSDNFPAFAALLLRHAKEAGVPVFILGGGANIVVSDNGIRGIVLDTSGWRGKEQREESKEQREVLTLRSGTTMDEAADIAASLGLSGLEFLAGMPGCIGGAVWMNARCYGSEIADVLEWTEVIINNKQVTINKEQSGFGYKRSPFQDMECLITAACFKLKSGDESEIRCVMEKNRRDREEKGHYLFPSAGSAFKNNRDFGKPTGQIIDELGLRSLQIGGAQIAPFHGNIVINTGSATAADIRSLMDEVAAKVKAAAGFVLEPEIIFVGE